MSLWQSNASAEVNFHIRSNILLDLNLGDELQRLSPQLLRFGKCGKSV